MANVSSHTWMTSKQRSVLDFCVREDDQHGRYSDHTCPQCESLITGKAAFDEHLQSCQKHFCKVCKKTFHSRGTYEKHLRTNCPPKRYTCYKCNSSYSRSSDAQSHERQCNARMQYKCSKCQMVFLMEVELHNHSCQGTHEQNLVADHPLQHTAAGACSTFTDDKSSHLLNVQVASIVLFDTETTGLIRSGRFPEIIELAFVAVDVDNIRNPAKNNIPRVLHKLTLCLRPTRRIGNTTQYITGMYQRNLACSKCSIFCMFLYLSASRMHCYFLLYRVG